jgi:hypothetical protein
MAMIVALTDRVIRILFVDKSGKKDLVGVDSQIFFKKITVNVLRDKNLEN